MLTAPHPHNGPPVLAGQCWAQRPGHEWGCSCSVAMQVKVAAHYHHVCCPGCTIQATAGWLAPAQSTVNSPWLTVEGFDRPLGRAAGHVGIGVTREHVLLGICCVPAALQPLLQVAGYPATYGRVNPPLCGCAYHVTWLLPEAWHQRQHTHCSLLGGGCGIVPVEHRRGRLQRGRAVVGLGQHVLHVPDQTSCCHCWHGCGGWAACGKGQEQAGAAVVSRRSDCMRARRGPAAVGSSCCCWHTVCLLVHRCLVLVCLVG